MRLLESARGLLSNARKTRGSGVGAKHESRSFQERMADGLRHFPGKVLLILSGQDYTAKEFLEYAGADAAWSGLLITRGISRVDTLDADHTFSSHILRSTVENATLDWLGKL